MKLQELIKSYTGNVSQTVENDTHMRDDLSQWTKKKN